MYWGLCRGVCGLVVVELVWGYWWDRWEGEVGMGVFGVYGGLKEGLWVVGGIWWWVFVMWGGGGILVGGWEVGVFYLCGGGGGVVVVYGGVGGVWRWCWVCSYVLEFFGM